MNRFSKNLLNLVGIFLLIKIVMQILSAFPYFADLAYSNVDFVIGYLHWTFLGVVSLAIFSFLEHFKLWNINRIGFSIFLIAFFTTEILIFYRGTAIWLGLPLPQDFFLYLFLGSCLFPVGIAWIFLTGLKKSRTPGQAHEV